jgi:hypothetical protein
MASLEGIKPPADALLSDLVDAEGLPFVDGLSLYSTMFPKGLAFEFLGIMLANLKDPEMTELSANAFVVAARSLWVHGRETGNTLSVDDRHIQALVTLGNLVGIAIIGPSIRSSGLKGPLNRRTVNKVWREANRGFLKILDDFERADDGTLGGMIDRTRVEVYEEMLSRE